MIRPYQDDDYEACCEIVEQAWDFAGHLHPKSVADFGTRLYTIGSLGGSNYAVVVEETGTVVGFLFGRAGRATRSRTPYRGLRGGLRLLGEFISLRGLTTGQKWRWFQAIRRHQINRARLGVRVKDEVTLFAVGKAARGKGYGGELMTSFVNHCRQLGIELIVVETDSDSSYGFYDSFGFEVVGEFDSPMNELFMGSRGRSWLYVLDLSASTG